MSGVGYCLWVYKLVTCGCAKFSKTNLEINHTGSLVQLLKPLLQHYWGLNNLNTVI